MLQEVIKAMIILVVDKLDHHATFLMKNSMQHVCKNISICKLYVTKLQGYFCCFLTAHNSIKKRMLIFQKIQSQIFKVKNRWHVET